MILLRHGQSHFNVVFSATREDPGIIDPTLTEEGRRQTRAAAERISERDIRRILVSPYTRTLETAEIVVATLDCSVTIEPLVRERCYFVCDIGTPRSELGVRWPDFDFGDLPERWWPDPEESEEELATRCDLFRSAMSAVEDWRHVLVISHWGFIRGLTGEAVENAAILDFDPTAA